MHLYHYTSDRNVHSILQSNKLRATVSTQSNDELDTIYLSKVLLQECTPIFQSIIDTTPEFSSNKIQAYQLLSSLLTSSFSSACQDRVSAFSTRSKYDKCCVICFTRKRDSRFLWSSYTYDTGISFRFNFDTIQKYLKEHPTNSFSNVAFKQIMYSKEAHHKQIKSIVELNWRKYYKNIDELSSISEVIQPGINFVDESDNVISSHSFTPFQFTIRQWILNFLNGTISDLLAIAPFIKHPYWEEEEEWRLVCYRPFYSDKLTTFCYQPPSENTAERYYIDLSFPKTLIEEIIISPKSSLTTESFSLYLNKGYSFEVNYSNGKGVLR